MLIDRCVIEIRSGKGGDGCISFLHDKNGEFGGPDGGNGGRGGSIYFVGKRNLNTLYNFRHSRTIIAMDGGNGNKKQMSGRAGLDVTVEVPVGTVISDASTGKILADIKEENIPVLLAEGGRGGKGNACYKSSRQRAPRIGENGFPGIKKRLILELKMVADAGLIGFPSVGKSTFLNISTKANVETADYPFTTISPNLGVVVMEDGESFVLADMPGLIEGAHEGKGLGIDFLRHIERTRVLIHMVSMEEGRDAYKDYLAINEELKGYGARLEDRPQIVVASKMDEDGALERKAEFDKKLGFKSYGVSAYTHEGLKEILERARYLVNVTEPFPLKGMEKAETMKVYDAHKEKKDAFEVLHPDLRHWEIIGDEVLLKVSLINTKQEEGMERLIRYLQKIGIENALRKEGIKEGDDVKIGSFHFTYSE